MKPRHLVTTPTPGPGPFRPAASGTVSVLPAPPEAETLRRPCASGDYDVVLTRLRDVLDTELPVRTRIRGISDVAVRHNTIDVEAATARDILVADTPGSSPTTPPGRRGRARARGSRAARLPSTSPLPPRPRRRLDGGASFWSHTAVRPTDNPVHWAENSVI